MMPWKLYTAPWYGHSMEKHARSLLDYVLRILVNKTMT